MGHIRKVAEDSADPITWRRALAALRIFILPVGIFGLAVILFSFLAFDIDGLVSEVKEELNAGQSQINPFAEIHARLSWATTVLLFYCGFVAAAIYSGRILFQSPPATGKAVVVTAGVVTGVLVLVYIGYSGFLRNNFSYIFHFTFDILTASGRYSASQLRAIHATLFTLNLLAGLVPILALAGGCCVLVPRRHRHHLEVEDLEKRMRELKEVLGVGAILLAAGVLHMVAWLRWPAGLVNSSQEAQEVAKLAEAMGLYWGATFSLLLAAFYIPAARSICRQAEAVLEARGEEALGVEPGEWLRKHGLTMTPSRQVPQFIAVLAPFLAGPVGSALAELSVSSVIGG